MASLQAPQAAQASLEASPGREHLAASQHHHCSSPFACRNLFADTPNSSLRSVRSGASHDEVDQEEPFSSITERVIAIGLYQLHYNPDRVRGHCDKCQTILFQTDLNHINGACHYAILCKCTSAQSDCLVEFRRIPPRRVEISLGPNWFGLTAPAPKALALLWSAPACLESFSEGVLWDACVKSLDDLAQ